MTGTGRQPRARRPSRRKSVPVIRTDLADRLRPLQTALRRKLARADVLALMIRAVNSSLDPERVGEELVSQLADWLPVPAWLVLAVDDAGRVRGLGAQAVSGAAEASARAVGAAVMRSRAMFSSADLSSDRRLARLDAAPQQVAAIGFPLECRGRTVGAVVGLDKAAAGAEPKFAAATLKVLLSALEPGAIALDNALRVQRAEALSVTDDLTQLYNSRYLSQVLRRETKRASRSGRPLSLLFIDGGQRHARPPRGQPGPGRSGERDPAERARDRRRRALRRRRVRRGPAGHRR